MQHDGPSDDDKDDVFEDETCRQCVERITVLQELIRFEEEKLSRAMKAVNKKD